MRREFRSRCFPGLAIRMSWLTWDDGGLVWDGSQRPTQARKKIELAQLCAFRIPSTMLPSRWRTPVEPPVPANTCIGTGSLVHLGRSSDAFTTADGTTLKAVGHETPKPSPGRFPDDVRPLLLPLGIVRRPSTRGRTEHSHAGAEPPRIPPAASATCPRDDASASKGSCWGRGGNSQE